MIRLCKYVCEKNHIICGIAYEDDGFEQNGSKIVDAILHMMNENEISHHCAICGSRTLHFSDIPTEFKTITEADDWAKAMQEKEMQFKALMDSLNESYDSKIQTEKSKLQKSLVDSGFFQTPSFNENGKLIVERLFKERGAGVPFLKGKIANTVDELHQMFDHPEEVILTDSEAGKVFIHKRDVKYFNARCQIIKEILTEKKVGNKDIAKMSFDEALAIREEIMKRVKLLDTGKESGE